MRLIVERLICFVLTWVFLKFSRADPVMRPASWQASAPPKRV